MSDIQNLKATKRSATTAGENKRLRKEGLIPAIIYGAKHDATNLQVKRSEIDTILNHAVGESMLLELDIDGEGKSTVLLQDVQHHPVTGDVLHVDLLSVAMDEKLTTDVPVEPKGEAVGVKNFGGILEQAIREMQIECLPGDLPEVFEADISELGIGDSLHIRDIPLPDGVECHMDEELTVFHVVAPRVVEEVEPAAEEATEPEVIGKEEEEKEEESKEEES